MKIINGRKVLECTEEDFQMSLKEIQEKWHTYSTEECKNAISWLSDYHKDVYGYRPRIVELGLK